MINIVRSTPPPPCLEKEKQKSNGDYKCGEVLKRLKTDFKNKCYICEYKAPPGINVEHFRPHRGDKDLKFDWNNLFWSCFHCNNIKGDQFENILDCTNPEHDVVNWIKYEIKLYPNETAKITALVDKEIVHHTVQLLHQVYNGTTELKIMESTNIRGTLLNELRKFQNLLFDYDDNGIDEDERKYCFRKIKKHSRKSSAFTAFKRWIVKENPILKQEFEQYFD
jgi:uncharacterized protein (TIGR02646 family)